MIKFKRPLVHGVLNLKCYSFRMSLREMYILSVFLQKGITGLQIFKEAITLMLLIYDAQEKSPSQEAAIYERYTGGEFRTVFTFGYKIHFIPRNTAKIRFNISDIEAIPRECSLYWSDYGEVEKLMDKYQLGQNQLSIFGLGLQIHFEMYSGIQNESIFYLNDRELKEILPRLS